jgi:hypothetical protein
MAYPSKYTNAQVEILGVPVNPAKQLVAGSASSNTVLTSTVSRISMRAVGADIRFSIGVGNQTANGSTSNFIANGERLDFAVPVGANIAVIRDGTVNGTLELTELI